MKAFDIISYFCAVSLIVGMLVFPYLLSLNKTNNLIEAYIVEESAGKVGEPMFIIVGIENYGYGRDISLLFQRESEEGQSLLGYNNLHLNKNSKELIMFSVNSSLPGKYSISIPEPGISLHRWMFSEAEIIKQKKSSGPNIEPDLPWELQDPYVQEYYRYN
ncbi:MAG: hypothetical protein ABIJ34_08455 [archaeon]